LTDLQQYYDNSEAAIKSGIFSLFAHPDIWLGRYGKWDKHSKELTHKLIQLCIKYKMPLGFNGNGLTAPSDGYHYPSKYFWGEVAKTDLKVLIEADSHHLRTFTVEWLKHAKQTAIEYGLKKNLVDDIPIKFFKH
jgi:histidinol-phosphatase (PHP family)